MLVQILDQLKALTGALDQVTEIEESELQTLFGNLEGFPYNTIGSSSRAFFLFYPLLAQYLEDPEHLPVRLPLWTANRWRGALPASLKMTSPFPPPGSA